MKSIIIFCFFALFSSSLAIKGVLEIDDVSWDRVVDGSKPILVSFQEYGWKHPKDYEKVSEELKENKVLVAKIDCSANGDLKTKFGVETYPTIKYFPKGETENPITYTGADSHTEVLDFVRLQMNPKLQELKKLAVDFVSKIPDQETLLKTAEGIVSTLENAIDKEIGGFYIATMKKIKEKGHEFIDQEITRLKGLIESKSTAEKKKNEFNKKLNTLTSFLKTEL